MDADRPTEVQAVREKAYQMAVEKTCALYAHFNSGAAQYPTVPLTEKLTAHFSVNRRQIFLNPGRDIVDAVDGLSRSMGLILECNMAAKLAATQMVVTFLGEMGYSKEHINSFFLKNPITNLMDQFYDGVTDAKPGDILTVLGHPAYRVRHFNGSAQASNGFCSDLSDADGPRMVGFGRQYINPITITHVQELDCDAYAEARSRDDIDKFNLVEEQSTINGHPQKQFLDQQVALSLEYPLSLKPEVLTSEERIQALVEVKKQPLTISRLNVDKILQKAEEIRLEELAFIGLSLGVD